ncbi:MAG: hypothetical protein CVU89_15440 [Firmicutes bacterium HGW-Firmicutes-14]|nr:MAG: hypothetical protein CVU89_15440 [Firmicutes bacterium HGW-Firmicutes-14]
MSEDIILDEIDKWGKEFLHGKGVLEQNLKSALAGEEDEQRDITAGEKNNSIKYAQNITGD